MRRPPLIPLIAAFLLTACASGGPPTPAPELTPPASLTTLPPESLPQPESAHIQDLLENHIEVARLYHRTREQLRGLVEWLEQTSEVRRRAPADP